MTDPGFDVSPLSEFRARLLASGQAEQLHSPLVQVCRERGWRMRTAVRAEDAPQWLRDIPAVEVVRRVWVQQFVWEHDQLRWRADDNLPPAAVFICSPYDQEAQLSINRSTVWTGYKGHVTETGAVARPPLLIHVATTAATTQAIEQTEPILQALATKQLLAAEHVVEAGDGDGPLLVSSAQQYGIDLLGPGSTERSWQGRAGHGFSVSDFASDWQAHQVTGPQGHTSRKWKWAYDGHGGDGLHVEWSKQQCLACPCRAQCPTAISNPRPLSFHPQAQHEALPAARHRRTTPEFKEHSALRAAIEGPLSQGVRACELRRGRYLGLAKTHLHHVITATAINVSRLLAWMMAAPLDRTRLSRFAALAL